jgi:alpha-1,2-mannosyltransferase
MVNSSWTEDHITKLWNSDKVVHKIYPPCDVKKFKEIKRDSNEDACDEVKTILSLGQFRPEKDHALQIRAMFELRQIIPEDEWEKVEFAIFVHFAQ